MHFCVIAPTGQLNRFAARSDHHLVLAHVARQDTTYFEWYRARAAAGDTVILDNGAYEGADFDVEEYLRLARELKPKVITVPDKVGDWNETAKLVNAFPPAPMGCALMGVVQQHPEASLFEWAAVYQELARFFGWIAFPRILGDRRVEFIAGLHTTDMWYERTTHHAFGMNAGSLDELPKLNAYGIYSIDSSAPVWRGLQGFRIDEELWPDIPFDASAPNVRGQDFALYLANQNLERTFDRCQSKWEVPSIIKATPMSASR
jgi:hypothetical protein